MKLPPDISLMGTALIVCLTTGIGAAIFRYLIRGIGWFSYIWFPEFTSSWVEVNGNSHSRTWWTYRRTSQIFLCPRSKGSWSSRGNGGRGSIRRSDLTIVTVVKSMASSITIGSGGSMGREGPIVLDDIYHSTVQISSLLIECK